MTKWIKSSNPPKRDGEYLTLIIDNGCSYRCEVQRFYTKPRVIKGMYGDVFSHWELTKWDDDIVTHWMPLPEPPK